MPTAHGPSSQGGDCGLCSRWFCSPLTLVGSSKANPVLLENVLDRAGKIIDFINSQPLRIHLFTIRGEALSAH